MDALNRVSTGFLEITVDTKSGQGTIGILPVSQLLAALQQIFLNAADTPDLTLGQFRNLVRAQRRQLLQLQVLDAHVSSLHLQVGPNYDLAREWAESAIPWAVNALKSAFETVAGRLISDAIEFSHGEYNYEIAEPTRKGLRSMAKAVRPDHLSVTFGIGILSWTLNYDLASHIEERELGKHKNDTNKTELTTQAVMRGSDALLSLPLPQEEVTGPYKGIILEIDPGARVVILQCEDYTKPIRCHYAANSDELIARLHVGSVAAVYGHGVDPSDRTTGQSSLSHTHAGD